MTTLQTLAILDVTLRILERQETVRKAMRKVRDDIQTMVDENREPTDAEWASLNEALERSDSILDNRADDARERLSRS